MDEDWPLYIKDNHGTDHQVVLEEGEMVWYESARLVHGRMKHFRGEFFDNLFIHFKPRGDWYSDQFFLDFRPWEGDPVTAEWVRKTERGLGEE